MKLCECGCGHPAPIAKANHRVKGHTKGEPVRFINGHNNRGPKSPETIERMKAAWRGKPRPWLRKPRPGGFKSEPDRTSTHTWLNRWHPKHGNCEECGKLGKTGYSFLHHPAPYTRERSDYKELCRSCHVKFDLAIGARGKGAW